MTGGSPRLSPRHCPSTSVTSSTLVCRCDKVVVALVLCRGSLVRASRYIAIVAGVVALITAPMPSSASLGAVGSNRSAASYSSHAWSVTEADVRPRSDVFRLNFDNGESLRPGTRVRDVTGHRHHATVVVSGRGRLTRENGLTGMAAGFPSACRRCGRAILQIADARPLDPGIAPFRFGAAVLVRPLQAQAGKDPNLVSKGLQNQRGGQYKLQLVGSRPRCTVAGGEGSVTTPLGPSLDDRRWHRVQCTRTSRVVSIQVDGSTRAQATGRIGRVVNTAPVLIGGKAVGPAGGNDQYHGDLDQVYLHVGR